MRNIPLEPRRGPLLEVAILFFRLGLSGFGGPAAHVALMQRELVERRGWISTREFLDLLAVSSLIPGPTSTELAMHTGRARAGWPGLVVAGLAFILPPAVLVGLLAVLYVRGAELPALRGVVLFVQPVVVVIVLQAVIPLARGALTRPFLWVIAAAAVAAALAGAPELLVLLGAGVVTLTRRRMALVLLAIACGTGVAAAAVGEPRASNAEVAAYFFRVGSLLFGSGYVLLPVLEGDLVNRYGWLSNRELIDAIAAGQATPGPLFTTATFIGYVLGGPVTALVATVAMFTPAFIFSAVSTTMFERLRASAWARAFLDGVNAAAVALIAVVLVTLARTALDSPLAVLIVVLAGCAVFLLRLGSSLVLAAAGIAGALYGWAAM